MLEYQKSSAAIRLAAQLYAGGKCLNTNTAVRSWVSSAIIHRYPQLAPNMKKKVALPLLAIVLIGVIASHISFKSADHSHLMVVDGIEIDVLGKMQNQWLAYTQNCDGVSQQQAGQANFQAIQNAIQSYSPPQSQTAQIASMWTLGEWTLAEVEFEALLPAVVTLQKSSNEQKIVPRGIWSGHTKPWMAAPLIRIYLKTQVPEVPVQLLNCFIPRSKSFS
jgi:hypothetical protein